ncbi:phosphoribosyltransferase family protein [Campylobacter sp. JMF_01 NE2]|uniref:phosphoribosyltransferase n=1 Tax=unclassified Campylobacter TaxID=2593542 RepID=UPI0022E9F323|nr:MULTISPECIES: phosphoribosyltransferase family protein [unclassified Campylobacter]MDA3042483.1 phosphoribosyltransferase family protein [Campylobacter sp. JMF_09 ED2]MDA3044703.1 phosphoribosyltransferase family protein [Campylobacter sp. JMF_07 ED4]MDA3047058.1 phosphoribosyltransferase family protein [Campylobacter sp. VBCF_06 NA8]MDA3047736.1 phosphoribosyltransferase family protein [Campylobacter sp. JMF_08 NE1]MDA3049429.1 phosphoribosyltransferase family protein [Campylobacter sp. JM
MKFYSFEELDKDSRIIAKQVRDSFAPDAIVAIARGGLTFGHALANALDMRTIFSINSIHYADTQKLDTIDVFNIPDLELYKRILLVDDIIDSGDSMVEIKRVLEEKYPNAEIKTAVIFYKSKALIQPDFKIKETDEWINFFWENYKIEE